METMLSCGGCGSEFSLTATRHVCDPVAVWENSGGRETKDRVRVLEERVADLQRTLEALIDATNKRIF